MSEPVGSLAEEAVKLIGAAEEWWQGARERVTSTVGDFGSLHTGPECVICPVCQLLAVVRTASPEVFEHLAAASGSLLLALKSAIDAQEQARAHRRTASSTIERIDIT